MVTTFNRGDLVSFGKYLLSQERTNLITSNHKEGDPVPLEERLMEVYHADVENWMETKGAKKKPNRKVKIGDTVKYYPSTDQEYDKYARNNNATVVPALVTAVWSEECVNLTVFPDAPYEVNNPEASGHCPSAISVTSCTKQPDGTHNPQTGMWDFR